EAAVRPGVGAAGQRPGAGVLLMPDSALDSGRGAAVSPAAGRPIADRSADGAPYRPPWWCRNRHLQTMWGPLFRRGRLPLRRERVGPADGDFVHPHWDVRRARGTAL